MYMPAKWQWSEVEKPPKTSKFWLVCQMGSSKGDLGWKNHQENTIIT
jgi:hypothetical protein